MFIRYNPRHKHLFSLAILSIPLAYAGGPLKASSVQGTVGAAAHQHQQASQAVQPKSVSDLVKDFTDARRLVSALGGCTASAAATMQTHEFAAALLEHVKPESPLHTHIAPEKVKKMHADDFVRHLEKHIDDCSAELQQALKEVTLLAVKNAFAARRQLIETFGPSLVNKAGSQKPRPGMWTEMVDAVLPCIKGKEEFKKLYDFLVAWRAGKGARGAMLSAKAISDGLVAALVDIVPPHRSALTMDEKIKYGINLANML